jgi:hypothetical protein
MIGMFYASPLRRLSPVSVAISAPKVPPVLRRQPAWCEEGH